MLLEVATLGAQPPVHCAREHLYVENAYIKGIGRSPAPAGEDIGSFK